MQKITQYKGVEIIGSPSATSRNVVRREIKCVFDGEIWTPMVTSLAYAKEAIDNALRSGVTVDTDHNALLFTNKAMLQFFHVNPLRATADGKIG